MDQHVIYAANRPGDDVMVEPGIRQLSASPAASANADHRVIANDWLRHAIGGIRVMHLDDDERRRVAERLF